mgnify:CR=1 FL=1
MNTLRKAGNNLNIDSDVLIAATPEEMRGLLDNLTNSAIKGKISPEAFASGITHLEWAGNEPNYTARHIRNTLKNPFAKMLVDNPRIAESMANQSVGLLDQFGIDSKEATGYIGTGMNILNQAKKDGLLRPDVTDEEVAKQIQQPLYSAIQGYAKDNRNNPQVNDLLKKGIPELRTPGRTPLEAFFSPEKFGYE